MNRSEIIKLDNGNFELSIYDAHGTLEHRIERGTYDRACQEIFHYLYKGGNRANKQHKPTHQQISYTTPSSRVV